MDLVTFATRVCKLLGIETMIGASMLRKSRQAYDLTLYIVTNAAGGLNENYEVGDIVCLNDVRRISWTKVDLVVDANSTLTWPALWESTRYVAPTLRSLASGSRHYLTPMILILDGERTGRGRSSALISRRGGYTRVFTPL
jgi:purine nucleoside phosphorylase